MPKKIEDIYTKKTQHEHILARPEMYIGPVQREEKEVWIFDDASQMMVRRKLSWVPGLYKIFDEILVNAADNKVRDFEGQTLIKVDIKQDQGMIRVYNNGEGVPVQIHKEHKMWVPEMIFGHLLTSSNYDDSEAKVTGGRNGFGAKLTNVFSRRFEIETVHRGKKFHGKWSANMTSFEAPSITDTDSDDYTQVTFYPDFPKFGMTCLEDDIFQLMKRRVYDIAGTTAKSLKVKLNGTTLPVHTFPDLVDLYPTMGEDKKNSCYSKVNPRWEVCVRVSNIGHQHVSFVNAIATTRGGKHVDYICDQVVERVIAAVKKKHKGMDPKPQMIRQHLFVFVNCLIENPTFDSQTKDTLTTTKSRFGSTCELPSSMMDAILKSGIVERTVATANSKVEREMASKLRTSDRSRITGIPKLEDANDAGTKKGPECTLILTEGDSAKALAVSGLSTIGRDKFGVFPLRGKPLNVRDVSMKKVLECEEIQHILKIVGLKVGTTYEDVSSLRYGRIMIMSDQDHDGSHIKGLIVNLVHHFWPQLLRVPGFLTHFITPIVKALPSSKAANAPPPRSFFSLPEFLAWRAGLSPAEARKYTFKYYKGLGTSTAAEGREYFQDMPKHRIFFVRETPEDEERIVMAFSKDRVEDRKRWITNHAASNFQSFDYTNKRMTYRDFIDKELILFSVADCERSIPSIIDGLKPGQRKILYSCFKRNLTRSIKVAQLAGYVSEHSAYHHGEASLTATIVNLAQDYVGSNNVPLLVPDGQFGTRSQGGKDSASARYIFTTLANVTRFIYPKVDDYIVQYKDDDGFPVEPHFYVPVIPMVLVNGTSGIGTGFATNIPNFSPWDLIKNVRRLLRGEDPEEMVPWYYGFNGDISPNATAPGKFVTKGKVEVLESGVVHVSELPIAYWTSQYKKFLEDLVEKELVVSFRENHTDVTVDFDIVLHPTVLRQWSEAGVLEEKLDLRGTLHTTNIIGFNDREALAKYANAEAVLKEFFVVRLDYYGKRKEYLINELQYTIEKLTNMVRFVNSVVDGTLSVVKKRKPVLLAELRSKGYKPFPPQQKKNLSKTATEATADEQAAADKEEDDGPLGALGNVSRAAEGSGQADSPEVEAAARDYDYLLGLRIWSLTSEMVARLEAQLAAARKELDTLMAKTPKDLWNEDLDKLEAALTAYFKSRDKETVAMIAKKKRKSAIDVSRLKIPTVLGDKGRAILNKDAEKAAAKDPNRAKRPRPKKKKKDPDADDDFDSTDEDDDDHPLAQMHAVRRPAPKKAAAPKPKRTIKKKATSDDDDDDDDSDSDFDGDSDDEPLVPRKKQTRAERPKPAAKKSPKKKSPAKAEPKKAAAKPVFGGLLDEDDEDLLLGLSNKPAAKPAAKKSPAKTAAAKKSPAKKSPAKPAAGKKSPKRHTVIDSDDDSSVSSTGSDDWYDSDDSDDSDFDSSE
eukprot:CAMPEP_0174847070 /NCGR_PEP_ID=MMETSP1114-20130205/12682_1 /TAXON_ID=312471 /ORGANISM="Neobodo designis, Strain CCAP 1951/1" /LENGTH=1431 /DNA_ID=CAMNT_0016081341 /DNA_START=175 /DNA_END=4470 /DNA_ORIENTATION=+